MKTKGILLAILILLTMVSATYCSVTDYSVTKHSATSLGFGDNSNAWAVDNTGGIMVESNPNDTTSTGYYVKSGVTETFVTNWAHEGGPFGPTMNSTGTIAYATWNGYIGKPVSITLWKDGVKTTSTSNIGVSKINKSGEIAGVIPIDWVKQKAGFRSVDGIVKEIGMSPTGESLKPTAIDDNSTVYLSTSSYYSTETYVWDGAGLTKLVTPWGTNCKVISTSEYGVLGYSDYALSDDNPSLKARKVFVLKDGTFKELPTLPGAESAPYDKIIATAMNDKGQITINHSLGLTRNGWNPMSESFVYDDAAGVFTQLTGVGEDYAFATAINDNGMAVGNIQTLDGRDVAVSWAVPEPTALISLFAGLAGLIGLRRRRK